MRDLNGCARAWGDLGAGLPVLGETPNLLAFADFEKGRFVRFHPDAAFLVVAREFHTDVHITKWGTRVTAADEVGRDTLVFLGDSMTFGYGVNDRETFVSLACRQRAIACLNTGFPGSRLSSQLDLVEHAFADWGMPRRLVFVFFAGNDLPELVSDAERARVLDAPTPRTGVRTMVSINAMVNASPVLSRIYLLQLAQSAMRGWFVPNAMDPMLVTASGASGAFGRQAASAMDDALARLSAVSARLGFTPSFVLLSDRLQIYPKALAEKARYYGLDARSLDMQFPQRMLVERLKNRGIPYQDVQSCFDGRDEGLYYVRDNHLTARGHAVVAGCLARTGGPSAP